MSTIETLQHSVGIDEDASSQESSLRTSTSLSSTGSSSPSLEKLFDSPACPSMNESSISELFGEHVAAKVWRVANRWLEQNKTLDNYPEFIPTTGENAGKYISKPAAFWTCGFFPASLYCLLERSIKYPESLPAPKGRRTSFHNQLLALCRTWSAPLHQNVTRTNSHDLGFITRALRMDWELTGNTHCLESYLTSALSLASRYDERVGAIRSWDKAVSKRYSFVDEEANFIVIIDSMCNLDLMFYAGNHTSNQRLIDIATSHAYTILKTLIRPDSSSFHFANLDPRTGEIKAQMTHQGYSDSSTWSRGQAWGILGFAQTYVWTKDPIFLKAAIALAEYFLSQLAKSPHPSPYVPLWDFDAPIERHKPLRDSSAGMIAANGLLLLHQVLQSSSPYLVAAMRIVNDTLELALSSDKASFSVGPEGKIAVDEGSWDAILTHATANNNEYALMRYSDHGLVYADYYFLEFGNKLKRMGLV